MSTTELVTESELKKIQSEEGDHIPETIGMDNRSHEMLLVLNEVFDSMYSSDKS
ncbi:MAG: hypothetical protein QM501_07475 [Gimesia sp.]